MLPEAHTGRLVSFSRFFLPETCLKCSLLFSMGWAGERGVGGGCQIWGGRGVSVWAVMSGRSSVLTPFPELSWESHACCNNVATHFIQPPPPTTTPEGLYPQSALLSKTDILTVLNFFKVGSWKALSDGKLMVLSVCPCVKYKNTFYIVVTCLMCTVFHAAPSGTFDGHSGCLKPNE